MDEETETHFTSGKLLLDNTLTGSEPVKKDAHKQDYRQLKKRKKKTTAGG